MVWQLIFAAVLSAAVAQACSSGDCPSEQASLIQVRGRGRTLVGAYARAAEAIRTADENAENICVKADAGDVAPVAGLFSMDGDDAFEVQGGYTAPKPGLFCIPRGTMALVERAHGFESRKALEAALAKKDLESLNPWGMEGAFGGKYSYPTSCSKLPFECKMSVYPLRHELCTVLWSMQNKWLEQLPGCGEGMQARRNVEGACYRDRELRLTCPVQCNELLPKCNPDQCGSRHSNAICSTKEKPCCNWEGQCGNGTAYCNKQVAFDNPANGACSNGQSGLRLYPESEASPAIEDICWAGKCDKNVTSIGVNEYMKATIVKAMESMPKFLTRLMRPEKDRYPCEEETTQDVCKAHCPGTCQMVLDSAVARGDGTAADLCAASCTGSHAESAAAWNNKMSSSLSAVKGALNLTSEVWQAEVAGPCDAASVESVCSSHCAPATD